MKNGRKRGKQTYKCRDCGHTFSGGFRVKDETVKQDYVEGKQTLAQLSEKYGVNKSTVWRHLRTMRHVRVISKDKEVVINMDTTYWGGNFGLMVINDTFRNRILWYKFVRKETVADYLEGIGWLQRNRFRIYGIVRDGFGRLLRPLSPYPVQMCQFHQVIALKVSWVSMP